MPNPILFCNGGWMQYYQGITKNDKIVGGGKYVESNFSGHEICNFVKVKGFVYGYVHPTGNDQIHIERIGATKEEDEIKGVDVVFTAKKPGRQGGTVIVGWYKNATVYRYSIDNKWLSNTHKKNKISWHRIKAKAIDATLLTIDQRTIKVPRSKGGMGTSLVWYADDPKVSSWLTKIRTLLKGKISTQIRAQSTPRQHDQAKKAIVESVAIEKSIAYYQELGYLVRSVERDNVGWDLEAQKDDITLFIEVKGLSGKDIVIELTPNEYKALEGKDKYDYRLCAVTSALHEKSILHVFQFNNVLDKWESQDGTTLTLKEIKGARLYKD